MRSNFEITGEEFVSLKNQLMVEIKNFDDQIKNLESKNEKDLIEFNDLVELLFFALDKWKSYDRDTKFQIINELVVELYFDKQKRLYIEEKLLYKTFKIYNLSKWSGGRVNYWTLIEKIIYFLIYGKNKIRDSILFFKKIIS